MVKHLVISPIKICWYVNKKGKESTFILNLNHYRNTNSFKLGLIKDKYTELMLPKLSELPKFKKVKLTYMLYTYSPHKSDVMNYIAVVDKFFQDTLVKAGKLEDDNYDYVPEIVCKWGNEDKANPRVEILIEEID